MKKVRLLVVAITVALLVMGIGYAAWSQNLLVAAGGTTTKMDVKFIAATADDDPYIDADASVGPGGCSVVATVTKLYPSANGIIHCTIKNFSTMPVIMDSVSLGFDTEFPPVLQNDILIGFNTTGQWQQLKTDANMPCNVVIEPQGTADFTFQVKLDPNSGNGSQNGIFGFVITPHFVSNK